MNIPINDTGCVIPATPVPDSVLTLAHPFLVLEDAPDGGLWFSVSPHLDAHDEAYIQKFFKALAPYVSAGKDYNHEK